MEDTPHTDNTIENANAHPFATLTPEFILDAVESLGFWSDGRCFALNSYENRVYQVGIDEAEPYIAKFYRPNRWTNEQILEDHQLCFELVDQGLPVVAPLTFDGESLLEYKGFRFSLFPRKGGHAPELSNLDHLFTLGRHLGRMHAVGAIKNFEHRPEISVDSYGVQSVDFISKHMIPRELKEAYDTLTADLLKLIAQRVAETGHVTQLRVHGDSHAGNILWRDDAPHFVDFDDARMAPAVQDIWMLLSGDSQEQTVQLSEIIDGYSEFYDFHPKELQLIEVFRTLRMMHYAAWLARRWDDPAFPHSFPWFNTVRYWSEHILELREQLSALQEPPLRLRKV
ncbi:MAG: serine/threonine protein kinase [Pontibacterium sp.]